jgi:uncharacterized protein (DUF1778 family)
MAVAVDVPLPAYAPNCPLAANQVSTPGPAGRCLAVSNIFAGGGERRPLERGRLGRRPNRSSGQCLVRDSRRLLLYARLAYTECMAETKTHRVHLRVAAEDDELLRSAAASARQTLSEFLIEGGRERAERVLGDRTRFMLSDAEWERFAAALDQPARENPALRELFRRPRPV